MVLTRFAWPHGGQYVYLTGSFFGWSHNQAMTLVEGSSAIFQSICDLPPGFHKFKFLVDGIWQHDEQQPHVTDEDGTVNNVILVREPEVIRSILQPGSSAEQNVDVINDLPSSSSGINGERIVLISDADVNITRHHLSTLLSRYTAYELIPTSGKVFVVDVGMPMRQAFHIMYDQGLVVLPIVNNCKGQIVGMLTASDFILILRELHKNGSMLTNEELETHSVFAWKEGKHNFNGKPDEPIRRPFRRPLVQAGPYESLKEIALKIMRNEISTVPVINSSMQDGSCFQLLHVACLAGILKYICRNFRHSPGSLPLLQQPIFKIPIGTWVPELDKESERPLAIVHPNDSLSFALNLLTEAQVSSVPVIDYNGSLLDLYRRSDITALARGSAYTHIRLDQMSVNQALQLTCEANTVLNGPRRCQTCLRSDSLHEIMELLSDPAVRRLVVIEAGTKRVEGIISLRDLFNFLLC